MLNFMKQTYFFCFMLLLLCWSPERCVRPIIETEPQVTWYERVKSLEWKDLDTSQMC